MEFISKGGYSEVFYDSNKKEIYRRSPKYLGSNESKEPIIDTSSICDLIYTKSFEFSKNTPIIHSYNICEQYINMSMPHYGDSLHHWLYLYPITIRKKYAAHILLQIINTCMQFEKNGFLHCDLKPSNIMIETLLEDSSKPMTQNNIKGVNVKIIDFNMWSVKILRKNTCWSKNISTWNFAPPEIIFYETPENNTLSWNIGIIASCIMDEYLFTDLVPIDMQKNMTSQHEWRQLFIDMYVKYPKHPPISRMEWYNNAWYELLWNCTHWCQSKRWNLSQLYHYIYTQLLHEEDKSMYTNPFEIYNTIPVIQHIVYIRSIKNRTRKKTIENIYKVCMKGKMMNLFPTAVSIFDRYLSSIIYENNEIDIIASACILISSCIFDINIVTTKVKITLIMRTFKIPDKKNIIDYIYIICKYLDFNIWEKPAHIILYDSLCTLCYKKTIWKYIKDAFFHYDIFYTQSMIAIYAQQQLMNETSNLDVKPYQTIHFVRQNRYSSS